MTTRIDLSQDVQAVTPDMIALRRALHQHPELAFEEVWTAATLAGRIATLGLPVQEGIGGTGVLAMLEGSKPGKTLLIRADIDALPMEDATGTTYASQLANRNYACGHDAHAAIVAGVAAVLVRHRDRIAGRIAFVFQPAGEPMRGAQRMIEEGLLEQVKPDMSLSVHVLPMAHTGQVVIQTDPLWASRDELTLHVSGPAPAHKATSAFDFARTAAQITTALYALVEHEGISPDDVTFRVRSLHAEQSGPVWLGGACGVPDHAILKINLALYDNALRARLLRRIDEVSRVMVSTAGGTLRIEAEYALPALVNDAYVTSVLEQVARRVIGQANMIKNWRNPFSDDFGLFMAAAPGCLMLLGTANPAKGLTEIWHRPGFDIDEDALPVGVQLLALAALDLLQ
jgi:amidohydrolase